ncbi:hypothetical protein B0H67DRAFT_679768 [Lasiosphaeris hirsuta]|uniref:DUF7025 domain-containing protein n=1 Tax=Lasiosphaeris hirsuta TaxID=260670 RepID=A0AA40E3U7_9PEZI|nr:hypothetical protein B0H67DRAFT_679768 [Lasiosphaeris hirsuta]
MILSVRDFFGRQPKFSEGFPDFDIRKPIAAPYVFWYHYRSPDAFRDMDKAHQDHMKFLTGWIEQEYGDLYNGADNQFSKGVVSAETMPFLVKPGDVLISTSGSTLNAQIANSWADPTRGGPLLKQEDSFKDSNTDCDRPSWSWKVDAWGFEYDGQFYRRYSTQTIKLTAQDAQSEVSINKLKVYPIHYADKSGAVERLKSRGTKFWTCRNRRLVAYEDDGGGNSSDRFMVDFQTYRQLHSDSASFERTYPSRKHLTGEELSLIDRMSDDKPPSEPEIYVFP